MSGKHPEDRPLPARYPQQTEARYASPASDVSTFTEEDDGVHVLDYLRVILVRRWTVLAVFLTVLTFTAISTLRQEPIYQATTRIQIDQENPNILSFEEIPATDDSLQTQLEILASRDLARRVIEDLGLVGHSQFQPGEPGIVAKLRQSIIQSIAGIFAGEDDGQNLQRDENDELRGVIDTYLGRLMVNSVRSSRLVDVSFDSTDPEFAALVMNSHAPHFIEQNLQFRFDATQEASRFLEGEVDGLQADLERAEDALLEYSIANDILFTQEGRNTAMDKLQQIEAEHTRAQSDRIQKEAYVGLIEAGTRDALPQVANNSFVSSLSSGLIDLQREEADLAVTFGPAYPRRQRISRQIAEIQRTIETEKLRVIETTQAEYTAAVRREELIHAAMAEQLDLVNTVNQEMVQFGILRREADSMQNLYNGLLLRLQEARVSGTLRASNIRVVDLAERPRTPIRPRTGLNLFYGVVAGLTFGIGLAFLQDHMDSSLKSPEDVARFLKIPTLASIPARATLNIEENIYGRGVQGSIAEGAVTLATNSVELMSAENPNSVMAEAYRSMRTSLLLSSADHPPRTVLVTSTVPSEGKTTTAINLAISLTQIGARVVLVDADMRKPRIHSIFSLGATPGLSALLTGGTGLQEVLHEVSIPNLFVLPCGVIPPNPAELLMSNRCERTVAALREYFDYVIIDSPPVAHVSDGRILSNHVDSTLLVVKAGSTGRAVVARGVDTLLALQSRVAGVVLNNLDVRLTGYDYYYPGYSGQYYSADQPAKS